MPGLSAQPPVVDCAVTVVEGCEAWTVEEGIDDVCPCDIDDILDGVVTVFDNVEDCEADVLGPLVIVTVVLVDESVEEAGFGDVLKPVDCALEDFEVVVDIAAKGLAELFAEANDAVEVTPQSPQYLLQ